MSESKTSELDEEKIIDRIEENSEKIRSFGVKKLTLFGSYAEKKATEESDLDFLVEFEEGRGGFKDYIHLLQYLEDLFEKDIDLVKTHLIKDELKPHILGGKKIEAKV
ncbi:MAG: nucleotidyltransferase domain-containing protein [Candidatus Thermoplasmatota archaeon]